MKKKVLVLAMHPAPYREAVFDRLVNKHPEVNIMYLYSGGFNHDEWKLGSSARDGLVPFRKTFFGDVHRKLLKISSEYETVLVPGWFPLSLLFVLFARTLSGKKTVFSCDTVESSSGLFHRMIFAALRKCSAFYVPGNRTKNWLMKSVGIPESRIFKGSYTLDLDSFKKAVFEKRNSVSGNKPFTYLFVGKLVANRNVPLLLKAFESVASECTDVRLVIIGDGECWKNEIESGKKTLGDKFVYVPRVTFDELGDWYADADCYVHPGVEPYSLATVQAVASECIVVSHKGVGCLDDYIEDGKNGFVIDSERPEDFAGKMKFAYEHKNELKESVRKMNPELCFTHDADHACLELEKALGLEKAGSPE